MGWFEERWCKLEPGSFVKHTLHGRCFYRKSGRDDTITLECPKEGYKKTKEEDGNNEAWFEERWQKLNNSHEENKKPWLKWDI